MALPLVTGADKDVKQSLEIARPSHVLGMELNAEERERLVHDPLVALIISICEQDLPIRWQVAVVHRKAVVLGGDETALGRRVETGLVVATVAVPVRGYEDESRLLQPSKYTSVAFRN